MSLESELIHKCTNGLFFIRDCEQYHIIISIKEGVNFQRIGTKITPSWILLTEALTTLNDLRGFVKC